MSVTGPSRRHHADLPVRPVDAQPPRASHPSRHDTRDEFVPGSSAGATAVARATTTPVTPPPMPAWYPAGYDLNAASAGAKDILLGQGVKAGDIGPGIAKKLVFSDVDLTLMKTATPTLLKSKTTGEYLRNPDTGRLVILGVGTMRDQNKELAALKLKWPNVNWADYGMDFREFGSLSEVMRTEEIKSTVDILKASDKDPTSRDFIITARGDDMVPTAMKEYCAAHGVDINGVMAVNNPGQGAKLWPNVTGLTSAQKKALSMAALIKLYDPQGATVRKIKFMDDTDDNLKAAAELLPALFPNIRFEFEDIIHGPRDGYTHKIVARTGAGGGLLDAHGKAMTLADFETYASVDAPFKPVPGY